MTGSIEEHLSLCHPRDTFGDVDEIEEEKEAEDKKVAEEEKVAEDKKVGEEKKVIKEEKVFDKKKVLGKKKAVEEEKVAEKEEVDDEERVDDYEPKAREQKFKKAPFSWKVVTPLNKVKKMQSSAVKDVEKPTFSATYPSVQSIMQEADKKLLSKCITVPEKHVIKRPESQTSVSESSSKALVIKVRKVKVLTEMKPNKSASRVMDKHMDEKHIEVFNMPSIGSSDQTSYSDIGKARKRSSVMKNVKADATIKRKERNSANESQYFEFSHPKNVKAELIRKRKINAIKKDEKSSSLMKENIRKKYQEIEITESKKLKTNVISSMQSLVKYDPNPKSSLAECCPKPKSSLAECGPKPKALLVECGPKPKSSLAECGPKPKAASAEYGPQPKAYLANFVAEPKPPQTLMDLKMISKPCYNGPKHNYTKQQQLDFSLYPGNVQHDSTYIYLRGQFLSRGVVKALNLQNCVNSDLTRFGRVVFENEAVAQAVLQYGFFTFSVHGGLMVPPIFGSVQITVTLFPVL